MDRTAKDLSLRAHGLLSSLPTRTQIAFRASLNLCSPETWLVLYSSTLRKYSRGIRNGLPNKEKESYLIRRSQLEIRRLLRMSLVRS